MVASWLGLDFMLWPRIQSLVSGVSVTLVKRWLCAIVGAQPSCTPPGLPLKAKPCKDRALGGLSHFIPIG